MRVFVIHDGDGNVVGMVRAHQDEGPLPGGAAGDMVTEIERPEDADGVFAASNEEQAAEAARAFHVEIKRRVVKR